MIYGGPFLRRFLKYIILGLFLEKTNFFYGGLLHSIYEMTECIWAWQHFDVCSF